MFDSCIIVDLNNIMQPQKSKELLMREWDGLYKSKEAKMILVGNVEGYKCHQVGHHYVIYNKTQAGHKDPLKGRDKSVFLPFDPKALNFSNIPNKQILFHINLDEELIIEKSEAHKITQNFFDKEDAAEDDQIEGHTHPLIINNSPVCRYDSLLSMYPDEELPQVVGTDIMLLLLNIFKVIPNIKVGYNSMGAGAAVNHLHFHLVYSEDLIGSDKLPIEKCERKLWTQSTLNNPTQEINLYGIGVIIDEIDADGVYAMVLTPWKKAQEELQFAQVTNSLSFVFGIITNELMQFNIPHNILVSDNGNTIYIFIRDFNNPKVNYGWLEFSGVAIVSTEGALTEQEIINNKKSLRVDQKSIEHVKHNIKKHLSNFS